jgi:hypothetical protein
MLQLTIEVAPQIDVVDMWTEHTPYPFNQLPKSYNSMVANPWSWRFGYTLTQPRFVHVPMQRAAGLVVARQAKHLEPLWQLTCRFTVPGD